MPALATSTSTGPPSCSSASLNAASTDAASVTSQLTPARPSGGSPARWVMATRSPASAKARAIASPMPRLPPVTSTLRATPAPPLLVEHRGLARPLLPRTTPVGQACRAGSDLHRDLEVLDGASPRPPGCRDLEPVRLERLRAERAAATASSKEPSEVRRSRSRWRWPWRSPPVSCWMALRPAPRPGWPMLAPSGRRRHGGRPTVGVELHPLHPRGAAHAGRNGDAVPSVGRRSLSDVARRTHRYLLIMGRRKVGLACDVRLAGLPRASSCPGRGSSPTRTDGHAE